MENFVLTALRLLIPVLALLIPVLGVIAFFIVPPLTKALAKLPEAQQGGAALQSDPRIAELERRVAELQSSLQRVLEQKELERKLTGGPPQA